MAEKRKREPNWLASEKLLLLDLVEEHFNIVENKKTDCVSMKQKLQEWEAMSSKYNSQTPYCSRTGEKLKSQWENMKKGAKKEEAKIRQNRIQTGGGPAIVKKEDALHDRIICLIKTSATGLFNPYDGDCLFPPAMTNDPKEIPSCIIIDSASSSATVLPTSQDKQPEDPIIKDVNEDYEFLHSQQTKDWGDYTPKLLKSQKSSNLETKTQKKNKSWVSRRRPTVPSTTTSEILNQKKIEAIEIQIQLATKESAQLEKLADIDMEIKKEILKQEKIKTMFLLLEKRKKKKRERIKEVIKDLHSN